MVVVGCLAGEKVDRQGRVLVFRLVYCWLFLFHQSMIGLLLAVSVSPVNDFSVSFVDFYVSFLELSLALARQAFLFSLRLKSLPSEISPSTFTSSSSVLFLILFDVFEKSIVVFVQFPLKIVVIHWQDARDVTRISVRPNGTDSCFGLTPTFGLHLLSLQPNFKVFILVPTT